MSEMPREVTLGNPNIKMNNGCEVRLALSGAVGEITGESAKYLRLDLVAPLVEALRLAEKEIEKRATSKNVFVRQQALTVKSQVTEALAQFEKGGA